MPMKIKGVFAAVQFVKISLGLKNNKFTLIAKLTRN